MLTPKHIVKQKQQLERILKEKWFAHSRVEIWLENLVEQTVMDLFDLKKGSFDYELVEIMQADQFKKALYMEL